MLTRFGLVCGICISAAGIASAAQIVENPYPDPILEADIRVGLEKVDEGLVAPVWATQAPGDAERLFVVDQAGLIHIVMDARRLDYPLLDVRPWMVELKPGFDERGLLGLAFHPGFADTDSPGHRKLYTYTSEPAADSDYPLAAGVPTDHISVLAEWQVSTGDPNVVDTNTRRVLLSFAQPQFNHNGGCIAFDSDGLLYIATGDGGAANDLAPGHSPQGNAQDLTNPLGKILRIDPLGRVGKKSANDQYSIPADNPRVNREGLDEIYAWGLRNVWRMSFDRQTGQLVAADVGQNKIEEISIIERGGNYGWPIKEGSFYFIRSGQHLGQITRTPPADDLPPMIDPVAEYDHSEGISITGGFVYRGGAIPELRGKYIFGDWSRPEQSATGGRLFCADLETGEIRELLIGADGQPVPGFILGFGEDNDGEIYLLTNRSKGPNATTGIVWKIIPMN